MLYGHLKKIYTMLYTIRYSWIAQKGKISLQNKIPMN